MKKFALCLMVLALSLAVVPQSNASSNCIHFTNFCDTISVQTANVGGVMGTAAYGGWDWLCTGNWTDANVIGNASNPARISGRGYSAVYSYLSPYTFGFTFRINGSIFDLYGTNGSSLLQFQGNQPFTISGGACKAGDIRQGAPRLSSKK